MMIACFSIVSIYSLLFITPIDPNLIPLFRGNPPNTLILLILISFPIMGFSWSLIEVNSITIIWKIAGGEKQGTYSGIFYFFSQAAAIIAPVVLGMIFDLS
ncbi:MAG: hypothetical protein ACFFCM_14470, partial [Promethearchaeota archaeon]